MNREPKSTSRRKQDTELRRALAPLSLALCRVGPHVAWQSEMAASGYTCKHHEAERARAYRQAHGRVINARRSVQRAVGTPAVPSGIPRLAAPLLRAPVGDAAFDAAVRQARETWDDLQRTRNRAWGW